jgi:GTP-binding protein
MADGCLLLVDAKDGPMPQTRFVLKKALELKLKVVVVINKVDIADKKINEVLNRVFDLFIDLGADDQVIDYPVVYASAKLGKAGESPEIETMTDITPIFEAIINHIPAPTGDKNLPLQMLITTITGDSYKGRIAVGRIYNGVLRQGQTIAYINRLGEKRNCVLSSVMTFEGLNRVDTREEIQSGDIVAIAGIPEITIGETLADPENPMALPLLSVEEPTVKMTFNVNTSPLAGKEGQFTTSRKLGERLYKELETDVALKVENSPSGGWILSGRGELHLAILIERLRREGYELEVSRPQVITKVVDGKTLVPYEKVFIEVPEDLAGTIIQKLGSRYGEMQKMEIIDKTAYLEFLVPTKGLFGFRSQFLTDSRGLGVINTTFYEFAPEKGVFGGRENGSLVNCESGDTLIYALSSLQERGELFYGPSVYVYKGQVIGQSSRPGDIQVNGCKEKRASNQRARIKGQTEHFDTPRTMGLEDSLEYINDDELVEVTPQSIRIRKKILDEALAKKIARGIKN